MDNLAKVFFQPGDIVTINKDIPNKPIMYVIGKKTSIYRPSSEIGLEKDEFLKGMLCRWFTSTGEIQEGVYNTKDLQYVK